MSIYLFCGSVKQLLEEGGACILKIINKLCEKLAHTFTHASFDTKFVKQLSIV